MSQLNIVNENDEVIGKESRENIHKMGLLHREVHVWIYNDKGEILFQKRAADKDTYPGLLDASAGGHVEPGESYEEAALKELKEETGLKADFNDLIFITKIRSKSLDKITSMTNNVIRQIFAYKYHGKAEDLKLENGKADSLEFWPINKILNISEKEKKKFIPMVFDDASLEIFNKIGALQRSREGNSF